MAFTLAVARAEARALLVAGDGEAALAGFAHALAAQPLSDELRLDIATTLACLGKVDQAGEIYRTLSMHLLRAGRPLPALVAAYALGDMGLPFDYLLESVAGMFAAGSPCLASFGARPAPVDPMVVIPDRPAAAEPFERLVDRVCRQALDFSSHPPYQEQVHPIPFLSELDVDSLHAILSTLAVRRIERGEQVVHQGDPGTSLFLVATGQLRVATTIASGSHRELARLHENSLFGEMSLVTSQPRGASVTASEPSIVLELEREALERVREELPSIAEALGRFTRERLIRNLLATSPLFTPFTKDQQSDLLRRFEGVEVTAGTTVIREGEIGQGLYVVLSGDLEVVAQPAGAPAPIDLGRLGPGDIFGEMALLTDAPTSATVRARATGALLFLPRIYVDRLAQAVPEVRLYFAAVAERRAADHAARLGAAALPGASDPRPGSDEPIELDDSDAILV